MYYFTRVVKGLIILLKEHGGIMAQASVAKFLLSARAVEQFPGRWISKPRFSAGPTSENLRCSTHIPE